jgi:YbbR domain-containing protein
MALREIITKDFGWKLFSLALAIAIWVTVNPLSHSPARPANPLPGMGMRTFTNLPVLVVSGAADVREVKIDPDAVTVTVSGRPEMITAMTGQEIRVIVDLTGIEAARGLRKRVDVSVPPGVAFINVEPPQVNVTVPSKRD